MSRTPIRQTLQQLEHDGFCRMAVGAGGIGGWRGIIEPHQPENGADEPEQAF